MILVTGSTGLVGSHLLFQLAKNGEKVKALKRSSSNLETVKNLFEHYAPASDFFNKIEWVEGDVLDVTSLHEAMNGITKVYHCAAYVSFNPKNAEKVLNINIQGTSNVVNACLENNINKLCYVSSTAAIGKTSNGELITEKVKWKEDKNTSVYSISKHFAEREVWRGAEEKLDVVIVNPCVIIGPGNWGKSSTSFFPQVWRGLKYYTNGGNAFVDVRDVATAMIKLMESEIKNEKFLVVAENLSFKMFFETIAEELSKPKAKIKAGKLLTELAWRIESIRHFFTGSSLLITRETAHSAQQNNCYSNQKIKEAIEIEFIPVALSIKETAALFLKEKIANHYSPS